MHWESPHELNAFRHLDATPTVVEFHEQPLKIRFLLNGVEHCHYPDVLVKRKGSQELWEIKPACDAEVPEVMARTRLLQRDLPRMGFTYQMVMGDRLSEEPRLSNVLKILKCGRNPISIVEYEQLRQLFQDGREITWASAQDALGANRSRLLCRAFLMGHICFDIEQQIVQEAKFWWTGGLNGRQVS